MAKIDEYLDYTGLEYYHSRIKNEFADKQTEADLDALEQRVDGIVSQGGEPNTIDTVSVNGTNVAPDANKNVDIDVPTQTSDLTNDGDGTSPFATEAYVGTNGGKIDSISVNGTAQTIDNNKNVDITVPTAVSDLTNDSGFQTAQEVSDAIDAKVVGAYKYKGSVATVADLPSSGNTAGDVYNVEADGTNYAWTGSAWDALGGSFDASNLWAKDELVAITTAEIDTIVDGE